MDSWKDKLKNHAVIKQVQDTFTAQTTIDPLARVTTKRWVDGRVIWYSHILKDLWWQVKNEHSLLGIFRASKYHPFARKMRLYNLIFCVCASFMFAAITEAAKKDCAPDTTITDANEREADRQNCLDGSETNALILSVIFGGVVAACGMILRSAAECKCFLDVSLKIIRDCCQCLGSSFVTCSLLWCVVFIVVGIVEIVQTESISGATFMTNFAISQGGSWVFEGPILTAKFFWTWKSERNLPESDTQVLEYRKLKAEYKAKRKGGVAPSVGGGSSPIAANQMMVMSSSTDNGKSIPAGGSGSGVQIAAIGPAPLMPPVSMQSSQQQMQQQQQTQQTLPGMVSIDVAPSSQPPPPPMPAMGPTSLMNKLSSAADTFGAALRSAATVSAQQQTNAPPPEPNMTMNTPGMASPPPPPPPPPQSVPFSTNMQFTSTQPTSSVSVMMTAPAPAPSVIAVQPAVLVPVQQQPVVMMVAPAPPQPVLHFGGSAVVTAAPTGMSGNMGSDIGLAATTQPAYYQPQQPQNNGFGQSFAPGAGFSHTQQQPQPMMYQQQQPPVQQQQQQQSQQQMQMQWQQPTPHTQNSSGQMMMASSPPSAATTTTSGTAQFAVTPATIMNDVKKALPQSLGRFF